MIKVKLEKIQDVPKSNIELYNNINRIPFLLTIDTLMNKEKSIYCRDLNGENFVELWFNETSKRLREVALLSLQKDTVKDIVELELPKDCNYYGCSIIESESILKFSSPLCIYRSDKSINICFQPLEGNHVNYYYLTKECYVGVNSDNYLLSIGLFSLTKGQIVDIFGF